MDDKGSKEKVMNQWNGSNRRKFPRVNYPCLITIRHEQGKLEAILTHTENIGIGGLSVIVNKDLPAFSTVGLEIDLLDSDRHIESEGKIVWSIRRKATEKKKPLFYDVGIEFQTLTSQDHKRLDEVIRHLALREENLSAQQHYTQRAYKM